MRRTSAAFVVVMLLATGACSPRHGSPTGATVPSGESSSTTSTPTSSSTSTTVTEVSYDVPAVIDQAYVQRVVSAYDKVLGDAIRILKRDGAVNEDFLEHLLAIYTEPQFEFQQRLWLEALAQGDLQKRPKVPGDPSTRVVSVLQSSNRCVVARADRNFRPTLLPGQEPNESPQDDYLVLVRRDAVRDPRNLNPTPWVLAFDGYKSDNTAPLSSCDD